MKFPRFAFLDHPRAGLIAAVLVPLLFGLLSMAFGQDTNWDLRNYHLYNGYALMHGRIGFDIAPAAFQTYFIPTLDVLYYVLNHGLSPRLAGFVLGWLHGLNFVLLAAIARQLLGNQRLALLLAGMGMLGAGFLSELGNTMGDNLSALPLLGALYLILRHWNGWSRWQARSVWMLAAAGALSGLSAGLKLTNATYAVALCLALLGVALPWWQRLRLSLVFGLGVLAGLMASAGWWFLKMWQTFGNPLFPQFNSIFRSPLAPLNGVLDTHFRPLDMTENLLWPFIFARDAHRVSELTLKLMIWPVLYVVVLAFALHWLWRRARAGATAPVTPLLSARAAFVLLFFAIAYLVWMRMFSIYRYLIPLELLAPLLLWLLWQAVWPAARRLAGAVLAVLALMVLQASTWGHAGWTEKGYSAEVPAFATPASSIVFLAHWDPPTGWMSTFFPQPVQVVSIGTGFPESPAWRARIDAAMAARPGPHYVLLNSAKNEKDSTRLHKLAAVQWLGLTDDVAGCNRLEQLMHRVRFQVELRRLPSGGCTFDLLPQHRMDLAAVNRELVAAASNHVRSYGLELDAASCTTYPAAIGDEPYPYQLCRVKILPK